MSNIDDDLILYWVLSAVSGSRVVDSSGWANNGLVRGNLAMIDDAIFGTCLHFPGETGDALILNQMLDFPEAEMSVCCWVKTAMADRKSVLLSYATGDQSNAFALLDTLDLKVSIGGNENRIGVDLSDGQWRHITVCWGSSDGQIFIYLDGDQVYEGVTAAGESIGSGGALVIGQDQGQPGGTPSLYQPFAGEMANLRMYRRLLSPSEVEQVRLADVVQASLVAATAVMQPFSPSEVDHAAI